MGMTIAPKRCFLTNLETVNYISSFDGIEYTIEEYGVKRFFRFKKKHKNSEFVDKNKHLIQGLIYNDKFPKKYFELEGPILDNDSLESILSESYIPKTPDEKIENLLSYLHSLQKFEGDSIIFPDRFSSDDLAKKLYFKNYQEELFYLLTLRNKGLITGGVSRTKSGTYFENIQLTYEGLTKFLEFSEKGAQSNRCFVAMSFSNKLGKTRNSIKKAIVSTGYIPVLIDEIHYDADLTINDALIAEIKKCKFLVADFTEHKHGVYFEAGFALGLKRPVIYLCESSHFDNTHFDTKHYPHIIYSNLDGLEKGLENKINAWIN